MDAGTIRRSRGRKLTVAEYSKHNFIEKALKQRKFENRFRELHPVHPGDDGSSVKRGEEKLINFCSNDYLGLSQHPRLRDRAQTYLNKYGNGATASRLISGSLDIHHRLEEKIADFIGTESALLFNSGFQANTTLIPTITDRHSLILADKKCHNSLLQGSLLSRADFKRFHHNDTDHLQELLEDAESETYSRVLIITESVFSMDGDRAPLKKISQLADDYQTLFFVDDAHAVGVFGENGRGLASDIPNIDIQLGTCGKAFGVFGAYVGCSSQMKDFLINFCPGFIYTTALPPAVLGSLEASVSLIPKLDEDRKKLHENIQYLKKELHKSGFNTGDSTTQIIPIIIGSEQKALELSRWLEKKGFLASAIRPPTVPKNLSRIRITVTTTHNRDHINQLLEAIKSWKNA